MKKIITVSGVNLIHHHVGNDPSTGLPASLQPAVSDKEPARPVLAKTPKSIQDASTAPPEAPQPKVPSVPRVKVVGQRVALYGESKATNRNPTAKPEGNWGGAEVDE